MRSVYLDERNAKIRRQYKRLLKINIGNGIKKPGDAAITELLRIYSAHNLTFDTMAKICRDPNYGTRSNGGNASKPP